MFDYAKIMQKNTVIHCDTEEKAEKLLKWADSIGLKWRDGDSYMDNILWNKHDGYNLYDGSTVRLIYSKGDTIFTYEDVLLNDFDLIYKIETGDFGNKCNVEHFKHWDICSKDIKTISLNNYKFQILENFNSLINSKEIFIGKTSGNGAYKKLNKTEILSAFCELAREKKWKVKVIYDGEDCIYDGKTLPDRISIADIIIKQREDLPKKEYKKFFIGKTGEVIQGFDWEEKIVGVKTSSKEWKKINIKLEDLLNNKKGEDIKMAGKKANVKVTVGFLDKSTGELEIQQRYHTEICLVSKDKRKCDVEGGFYEDVICLEVDGVVEIPYLLPKVVKTDNREDKLKLIVEQCKLNNKILLGLIDKTPEIEGKLLELQRKIANTSSYVSYELDWNVTA